MKLYYENILLGDTLASINISIQEALEFLEIDMNEFAQSQGWDNWDWDELRAEY